MSKSVVRTVLREPLVHFAVLGALLFGAYGVMNRDAPATSDTIVVDRLQVDALARTFERTWQREPTATELRGLIETWMRDEVLYREGLASRLDRDDTVIRRRVVQKMTMLLEEMGADAPEDAELQRWFDTHRETYRLPPVYSLRQVYLDPQRHGPRLPAVARDALTRLRRNGEAGVGETTLLPERLDRMTSPQVAAMFGARFAEALRDLPVGVWSGPIESSYGAHLVLVTAAESGRAPDLSEVRQAVLNDVTRSRAEDARDAFLQDARQRYTFRVDADIASLVSTTDGPPGDRPTMAPTGARTGSGGSARP